MKLQFNFLLLIGCLVFGIHSSSLAQSSKEEIDFSHGWVISEKVYNYICSNLPAGSTILELGSGWGSGQLSQHYTVYSVEHDKKWTDKYDTNYIYAPIKDQWYDSEVLKKELPQHYDMLLIDGPPQTIGRLGFLKYLNLFNLNVLIIVDDVHRKKEMEILMTLAEMLGRTPIIVKCDRKKFGILPLN